MKLTKYLREAFVNAAMSDVPTIDYVEQSRSLMMKVAIAELPRNVAAVYNNTETRAFVAHEYTHYGAHRGGYFPGTSDSIKAAKQNVGNELAKLMELEKAQGLTLHELRAKLEAVAAGCTTRKSLAEALPEFAKYLPSEEQTSRNLPVIANVVSEFVKAGWPKDNKK